MDTVYGTKKYFQSLSGASDIYRSPACRAVSNDYTYQNTLGRRSTLGAYYHMNNQPSYSNDISINNQYGYNTWGIWRDGRNLAPSTFSAKANINGHYQKTRSFSIILTTAAFIVLLAVISIAGLAFYFSSIKGHMEDPVLGFEGSFRIAKGDIFSTGLKYNHTSSYKQKIEFYKRFVERALIDQGLLPLRTDIWGFGEGPLIMVNFRTFFDVRKLPQNIHNVEEYIKESLFLETTAIKSLYKSLRIDADSMEIKRILDEQVVRSASLFKDGNTVPTSQTQLEKRLMKKTGNPPALINKPSTTSKARTPSMSHSPDDEPDVDVENAPVIQGSFEGSFEITKTDADIALKKTTPTRGHTMGTLAPKAVTPYALRVKPKKPGIEKLTTVIPQHQTITSNKDTSTTVGTTTTSSTTTTQGPITTTTKATTTTTAKPPTATSTTTTTPFPTNAASFSPAVTSPIPTINTSSASSTITDSPPTLSPIHHQNYPAPTLSSSMHSLPQLDQNLFTSVPILDTQPWRPIHREVPEFMAGPPPSFPTKTLPTVQMTGISTSVQIQPVINEEPPRRRIDEIELPFLPEEPRPPVPALESFNSGKPGLESYKANFYGLGFRKPDRTTEIKNSQDLMFYHSFGSPVFKPGSEGIELLGTGVSVQPHPLPVPLIDDVVIPPFKPLHDDIKDPISFDLDSNNEKFEHLGDGVIAKKKESTTKEPEIKNTTFKSNTDREAVELTTEPNREDTSTALKPKDELMESSSATTELADKIGEFLMDLLDLPKDDIAKNKEQTLESRIEADEAKIDVSSTSTEVSKEVSKESIEEERINETTARFVADESSESTSTEVGLSTTTTMASTTAAGTSKPNFLNLKELILQRNQLSKQNPKKSSNENYRNTSRVTASTWTTTATPKTTTTKRLYTTTTTTKRHRNKPALSRPPTILDDSNLFPSHSKWEFINNSATSQYGHTGNMRKVFNTTLQAWVSEDVEKTDNFTLNELKSKINNATNIQDISLIFDTLASKLGITPSVPLKVPPFSYNKLKQTQNNDRRSKPISSTTKATTTPRTTSHATSSSSTITIDSSTIKIAQSTTPTPYGDLIYESREPFLKPMSSFIEDSSAEGVGGAIPVVGEAEVEVIDPTKYEEMLRSSQFADATTTETTPKLVTLLPVRSNSGIRIHKPFVESARSSPENESTTTGSTIRASSPADTEESADAPTVAKTSSSTSSSNSTSVRKRTRSRPSSSLHRAGITLRKNINQSRRFPPPEAVIRGGLKVTVK